MARKKRKGSSKAGRPKKEGARYPSGKLKPQGPNETVIERRKIGDVSAGEHPLDFALGQGWLTERQHRDAMSYRACFNLAHSGAGGPRLALGSLIEVEPSENLRMSWSQLSDVEITDIFDRVFSGEPLPGDRERAQVAALVRWKLMNAALTSAEREEMFMVCVLGSWPFWMPKKAAGHAMGIKDVCKEERLLGGLVAVGRAVRPPRARAGNIVSVPFRRTRANRAEVAIRYETEEGQEVTPTSERGIPFEATILRKRA